jgi:hypothetical protein
MTLVLTTQQPACIACAMLSSAVPVQCLQQQCQAHGEFSRVCTCDHTRLVLTPAPCSSVHAPVPCKRSVTVASSGCVVRQDSGVEDSRS